MYSGSSTHRGRNHHPNNNSKANSTFASLFQIAVIGFVLVVFGIELLGYVIHPALQQLYGGGCNGSSPPEQQQQAALFLSSSSDDSHQSSKLFPRALDLLKRNVDLSRIRPYSKYPDPSVLRSTNSNKYEDPNCNCEIMSSSNAQSELRKALGSFVTSKSKQFTCCQRLIRRGHKMGIQMTEKLFQDYSNDIKQFWHQWEYDYTNPPPVVDYRNVLILRNIYKSLLSGYLYHVGGQECWISQFGERDDTMLVGWKYPEVQLWESYISYDVSASTGNKTNLCSYLVSASEEDGMRAYIEWVFHIHYNNLFEYWAMSQGLSHVTKRTLTVCYEDLSNAKTDVATIDMILDFLYDGPYHKPWNGNRPGKSDAGGHATTKDPELRARLTRIIHEIDQKYYSGDIAWLNSVLPC